MSRQGKPNIVFVLCDNVGWGDFGVYGGGTPTPRIDQLAGEGIHFSNYTVAVLTKDASGRLQGDTTGSVHQGLVRDPAALQPTPVVLRQDLAIQ